MHAFVSRVPSYLWPEYTQVPPIERLYIIYTHVCSMLQKDANSRRGHLNLLPLDRIPRHKRGTDNRQRRHGRRHITRSH